MAPKSLAAKRQMSKLIERILLVRKRVIVDGPCALVVPRSYLDGETLRSYCMARGPSVRMLGCFFPFASAPKKDTRD